MKHRAWLGALLIGFVLALVGAQSALAVDPTLYVKYTNQCTFTITGDNGAAITVIPPGHYQVLVTSPQPFAEPDLSGVTDPNVACGGSLSFHLTGPGVNVHTTLEDGDSAADQLQGTFEAGGTYTAVEDRRPTVARVVFTVVGGSREHGRRRLGPGRRLEPVHEAGDEARHDPRSDRFGARHAQRQRDTVGKLTLTFKGKAVSSLKAGRYRINVLDETSRTGFTIQKLGKAGDERDVEAVPRQAHRHADAEGRPVVLLLAGEEEDRFIVHT